MAIAELAEGFHQRDVVYRPRISLANLVTYRSEFLCGEAVTCTQASSAQRDEEIRISFKLQESKGAGLGDYCDEFYR